MSVNKKAERLAMAAAAAAILILLAVAAFAQSAGLQFFGPLSRVITPNGDASKPNGTAVFCVYNPAQSDVSGKVYSLLGAEVATISSPSSDVPGSACPRVSNDYRDQYLTWDGRSNGTVVRSGVYVYRITAELRVYSGTLIVVR